MGFSVWLTWEPIIFKSPRVQYIDKIKTHSVFLTWYMRLAINVVWLTSEAEYNEQSRNPLDKSQVHDHRRHSVVDAHIHWGKTCYGNRLLRLIIYRFSRNNFLFRNFETQQPLLMWKRKSVIATRRMRRLWKGWNSAVQIALFSLLHSDDVHISN